MKLSPSDLRIGNWLTIEGKPVQVESIDPLRELPEHNLKCSIQIKQWLTDEHYTFTGKWLNYFRPIPLSPEWLELCGFINGAIDCEEYWTLEFNETEKFSFTNIGLRYGIQGVAQHEWSKLDHIINFHQLQNLYYCLTGEELPFTPPSP